MLLFTGDVNTLLDSNRFCPEAEQFSAESVPHLFRCFPLPSGSSNPQVHFALQASDVRERGKPLEWEKCLRMRTEIPQHTKSQHGFPAYSARDLHGNPICVSNIKTLLAQLGTITISLLSFSIFFCSLLALFPFVLLHLLFRLCLQLHR